MTVRQAVIERLLIRRWKCRLQTRRIEESSKVFENREAECAEVKQIKNTKNERNVRSFMTH